MKRVSLILAVMTFVSFSVCRADESALQKAYSLYYKGDKQTAIQMIEDYVQESPDPEVYYFLGYAYYEMQEMDKANHYFKEAYRLKSFYSPMSPKEDE